MKPPTEDRVVRLPAAEHAELTELLPWYVTDRLDADERTRVEAHLTRCRSCRAEVAFQQRLGTEVASLPIEVEHGWAQLRRQIESEAERPWRRLLRGFAGRASWLVAGGALTAAVTMFAVLPSLPSATPTAEYSALGAAEPQPVGEIVVVFRDDASERQVRDVLRANGMRVVDGPTSTDAYVLDALPGRRDAALESLRLSGLVTLAEPLAVGPDR